MMQGEIKDNYKLSSYYKYVFTFKSIVTGKSFSVGGDAGDIYRLEIDADKEYNLQELEAMN